MTEISAKLVLASRGSHAPTAWTFELIYPLPIHAEFMTHRAITKNSASLRAIPTKTVINRLRENPFIPIHWGANEKGMQASIEIREKVEVPREDFFGRLLGLTEFVDPEEAWLRSMESQIKFAEAFADAGYHKQVQNRLLSPFLHNRVLASGVDWMNFKGLRNHPDAEPHIHVLAKAIIKEMERAEKSGLIQFLDRGDWHLPYIRREERWLHDIDLLKKVSVARCARVSYNLADGRQTTFEEDLALYERLAGQVPVHASPTEHQLSPDYVERVDRRTATSKRDVIVWQNGHLHGNTPGWIQFRKTIPGETFHEPWRDQLVERLTSGPFADLEELGKN